MRREKWVKFILSGVTAFSMIPALSAPVFAQDATQDSTVQTTEKTYSVIFVEGDESNVVGRQDGLTPNDQGVIDPNDIKIPTGYKRMGGADAYPSADGYSLYLFVVPDTTANTKTITVNYVDITDGNKVIGSESVTLDVNSYLSQKDLKNIPADYIINSIGDISNNNVQNVYVVPNAKKDGTRKVMVQFCVGDKIVGTKEVDVKYGAYVDFDSVTPPDGYEYSTIGGSAPVTDDGSVVMVTVLPKDPTNPDQPEQNKTIDISYVDQATNRHFGNAAVDETVTIPASATSFDASLLAKIPQGYETVEKTIALNGQDTVVVAVRPKDANMARAYFEIDQAQGSFFAESAGRNLEPVFAVTAGMEVSLVGVKANDGYTWTGWTLTDAAGNVTTYGTDAKNIKFPDQVSGTYVIRATFTKNEQPIKPSDKPEDKGNTKTENKTDTNTTNKNTQTTKNSEVKKTDAQKTKGVDTGADTGFAASTVGISVAGIGIVALLRKKKENK